MKKLTQKAGLPHPGDPSEQGPSPGWQDAHQEGDGGGAKASSLRSHRTCLVDSF